MHQASYIMMISYRHRGWRIEPTAQLPRLSDKP